MIITVGGEAIGVLGFLGGGLGAGLWFDPGSLDFGPYLYVLAGGGLGAFGGGTLELGVYRDREAFTGRALEVGGAAGCHASWGVNASLVNGSAGVLAGVAGDVGMGGGAAAWALAGATWAATARECLAVLGVTARPAASDPA